SFDLDEKVVVVCDLCGGDPKCIKWCPQKAIELNTKHVMKELALKHAAKRDIIELEIGVQGIRR
ncbi:MAG: hypothetical protein ACE5PO_08935, partial [Candidatus Bathyarchaeia archaeon]